MAKNRQIGQVLKQKKKNPDEPQGFYIKIDGGKGAQQGDVVVTLKHGDFINVDDPRTLPDKLLSIGAIDEETHTRMKEQSLGIPDFVKFNLTVKN
jgi:hypothetical protein